jgi:hypothetical protein
LSEAATTRGVGWSGADAEQLGRGAGVGLTESEFYAFHGVAMGRKYEGQGGRNR